MLCVIGEGGWVGGLERDWNVAVLHGFEWAALYEREGGWVGGTYLYFFNLILSTAETEPYTRESHRPMEGLERTCRSMRKGGE